MREIEKRGVPLLMQGVLSLWGKCKEIEREGGRGWLYLNLY